MKSPRRGFFREHMRGYLVAFGIFALSMMLFGWLWIRDIDEATREMLRENWNLVIQNMDAQSLVIAVSVVCVVCVATYFLGKFMRMEDDAWR